MLLVEYRLLDKVKVINEGSGGQKKLKLRGVCQRMEEENNNGRIYPKVVLEAQVEKIQGKIKERSLVGALDHPPNDQIHLSQASHLITKLWCEGNEVYGEFEILSTPNGKIVEALINDGVKIGISSRGLGSVSESKGKKIVNEDFQLITFDLVSDPSTKGAYPELTESVKRQSEKAKKIVESFRKEQIFVTALKSKLDEGYGSKYNTDPDDAYDRYRDSDWGGARKYSPIKFRQPEKKSPTEKKVKKPASQPKPEPKMKQKTFNFGEGTVGRFGKMMFERVYRNKIK